MLITKLLLAGFGLAGVTSALPKEQSSMPLKQRKASAIDYDFNSHKVRGVNLGGWLVLEPWITPSIFDGIDASLGVIDEYTFGQQVGSEKGLEILRKHWDTWATWADFKKIKDAGFNSIRIPIGYWAYANVGEPYITGQAVYIDNAIDWARDLGLKVWIDLHGAPGSQNGFDNSGHKTTPGFGQGETVKQTLAVLKTISEKFGDKEKYGDVVTAIELLNEPLGPALDMDVVRQFHRDGFYQTREKSQVPITIHDAFLESSEWTEFLTPWTGAQNVLMDHHEYQAFDDFQNSLSPAEHRELVCTRRPTWYSTAHKVIVGEWSAAFTDCAYHLNGYKKGARYEGSFPDSKWHGSCENKRHIKDWSEEYKNEVRGYVETQLDTFEKHAEGWFFWNFKTEGGMGEWDALALVDAGLFPQPLGDRKFERVCKF